MSARPWVGAGTFTNLLQLERNNKMTNPVHAGYGVTHTLEETAQLMGITRERVRQIEKRALEKLRAALKNRYGITSVEDVLGDICSASYPRLAS